jgi:hypothetical protein
MERSRIGSSLATESENLSGRRALMNCFGVRSMAGLEPAVPFFFLFFLDIVSKRTIENGYMSMCGRRTATFGISGCPRAASATGGSYRRESEVSLAQNHPYLGNHSARIPASSNQ